MSMNKPKQTLTKLEDLNISSSFKIIDSGLLAICVIFMQYLIYIEKPDWLQTISLVLFSVAIPSSAFHFFVSQTTDSPEFPARAYLVIVFKATFYIGLYCTFLEFQPH